MLHDVILPKTGIYNDDVTLLDWEVEEGAAVSAGDVLLLLQTDKVEVEVEADADGFLHRLARPDTTLPIGSRVGVLASTREEYERLLTGA